jgi:hypothetical protein
MIASRLGFLVLPVAVACVAWLGCLALDGLHVFPGDPCVEEAAAVVVSYGPCYDEAAVRLKKAAPGSPEAKRIEEELRLLGRQLLDDLREVYRRHGRELPR